MAFPIPSGCIELDTADPSAYTATLLIVNGCIICTQADDVILVTDELWRQFEAGGDDRPGAATITEQDGAKVLAFGLAETEVGLGRLSYRWVCFVPQAHGWHVLERITT